jgi:hypothetical protein
VAILTISNLKRKKTRLELELKILQSNYEGRTKDNIPVLYQNSKGDMEEEISIRCAQIKEIEWEISNDGVMHRWLKT